MRLVGILQVKSSVGENLEECSVHLIDGLLEGKLDLYPRRMVVSEWWICQPMLKENFCAVSMPAVFLRRFGKASRK